jgi:hypothetical protein
MTPMATRLARSLALIALTTAAASPAFAAKDAKQIGDIVIKALEDQIHDLRGQEKAALNALDERDDYVLSVMDPKGIHKELEETLVVLRRVKEDLGRADDLNLGGYRAHIQEATEKAERQVDRALQHETAEERAKAANDLGAVHDDLAKGLAFSEEHPPAGNGAEQLQRRAATRQRLTEATARIAPARSDQAQGGTSRRGGDHRSHEGIRPRRRHQRRRSDAHRPGDGDEQADARRTGTPESRRPDSTLFQPAVGFINLISGCDWGDCLVLLARE